MAGTLIRQSISRSRRKTPIIGHTMAASEAKDKRLWHKRWSSRQRDELARTGQETDILPIHHKEVSDTWNMDKDGKYWFSPHQQLKCAASMAARRSRQSPERKALQARLLARWKHK